MYHHTIGPSVEDVGPSAEVDGASVMVVMDQILVYEVFVDGDYSSF